jgi:hypothetical protein
MAKDCYWKVYEENLYISTSLEKFNLQLDIFNNMKNKYVY